MKRHDTILRGAILAGIAVLSLLFFSSVLRRPAYRAFSGVSYPQYGVSLFWEIDTVVVKVDDREERVPKTQFASSAIYQEAVSSFETWRTATPEEVGIDSVPLVEMFDFVRERQIPVHSIQLVRRGRLVLDAYF